MVKVLEQLHTANHETSRLDVTQIQLDVTQIQLDVTQIQLDVTQIQLDVTQIQLDVTQIQCSRCISAMLKYLIYSNT